MVTTQDPFRSHKSRSIFLKVEKEIRKEKKRAGGEGRGGRGKAEGERGKKREESRQRGRYMK
jgi:hypothetical protein